MTIEVTRALTLQRPWASLILHGDKRVENRTWPVPKTVPLPAWIALHDGRGVDRAGLGWLHDNGLRGNGPLEAGGRIIAVMQVTACQDLTKGPYTGPGDLRFAHGPWAWHIGSVIALPRPFIAHGLQGLWVLPFLDRWEINRQLAEVQP